MKKSLQNKKEKILTVAQKLFYEKNFATVSTDEIAKAASVGKGTIYNYFSSKNDILIQMAIRIFDDFAQDILASVDLSKNIEDFVENLVDRIFVNVKVKSKILFLFHKELKFNKDTYIGITKKYQEAIFEAFSKFKNEISLEQNDFYLMMTNFLMTAYLLSNDIDGSKLKNITLKTLVCALK